MCGILGVVVNKNTDKIIRNLYELFIEQKNRGLRGAGISIANDGEDLFRFRSVSPFRVFNVYNKHIWEKIKNGSRVLFHHRYPTSSVNEPKFNHPIANETNTIHLIHNGILYDYMRVYNELKDKHSFETLENRKNKSYTRYYSYSKPKDKMLFTDTEVIVHTFEDAYNDSSANLATALKTVYKKISGSYALAMNIKGVEGIVLMKHSCPIIISKDEDNNWYFSSELCIGSRTRFVKKLKEGECGILTRKGYQHLVQVVKPEHNTKKKKKKKKIDWLMGNDFGFSDDGFTYYDSYDNFYKNTSGVKTW